MRVEIGGLVKNRELTMVAVWVLVHPGYPVTTTETYYSRTYYVPTYLLGKVR